MKTGEHIEGLFKQATPAGVVMEVGGQSLTVPIAKVRAIYLGSAPDTAKAGSSATEAIDALKGVAKGVQEVRADRPESARGLCSAFDTSRPRPPASAVRARTPRSRATDEETIDSPS